MLLISGGAYAGKRRYLRSRESNLHWHSAYEGMRLAEWQQAWHSASDAAAVLVLEGWEQWIADELQQGKSPAVVRKEYGELLQRLKQLEASELGEAAADMSSGHRVVLLMLEIGRGIVPVLPLERALRDAAGWLQQDAAASCGEAVYIWHGLAKVMKPVLGEPQLD
ncbi:adenosylcobinamide kinase [Xylanibacillus composti]|uniref:Adenosylcobinamide kinase n=1 Tax=Xylanibacillus composti TaxID=1572762 RepID=A0A8J4H1K2_9BACL|nr:bifunctional adenosylcobinamide kinase/adenosylcobinamide-phosphate guanylyltransferase [Xylanibacillus composti]MDT9725643.1 adenosylcobinamide kinase [Xylanibacillus composti]GIQ67737.1 hypothetical protein XYCOK13_05610 [Xylanibacillus composti]